MYLPYVRGQISLPTNLPLRPQKNRKTSQKSRRPPSWRAILWVIHLQALRCQWRHHATTVKFSSKYPQTRLPSFFFCCDLGFDPMTLEYELRDSMRKIYPHTNYELSESRISNNKWHRSMTDKQTFKIYTSPLWGGFPRGDCPIVVALAMQSYAILHYSLQRSSIYSVSRRCVVLLVLLIHIGNTSFLPVSVLYRRMQRSLDRLNGGMWSTAIWLRLLHRLIIRF